MSATIPRRAAQITSTSIEVMIQRLIFFLAVFFLILPHGISLGSDDLSDKAMLLKNADAALMRNDRKTADFYVARYLGVCARKGVETCAAEALEPFLKKRRFEPKAFLPNSWDITFIDWFENCIHERWGIPSERIREKSRSFEIAQSTYKDKYFITVVAYPELEQWYILKDGLISRSMLLALGRFRDHPTLFFGKMLKGSTAQSNATILDTQKRTLHYVWKPEFYDIDGDGEPEIWIRFNLAWGNGYSQILEVYKIRSNGKLELFHHFQGGHNGYARRLEDGTVELAAVIRSTSTTYHIEKWNFENKEFKKSSEKDIPLSEEVDWPPAHART